MKEVGLCEFSGNWLREYHKVVPIAAVQQEWSLLTHNHEEKLIPECKDLNVDIVAYSPLARNLFATKLDALPNDWRARVPLVTVPKT